MHTLSLANFARVIEGTVLGSQPYPATTIEHVATHSARIRTRAAFFALSGLRSNGRDYLAAAARNGAVAAVLRTADADERALAAGIPVIAVDDPLHSLQLLAAWWRESLSARFIAVVGSNGKTVTKDCLALLLSTRSSAYASPGSYNSQLGVPLAILDCPETATVAVIEVAVSDPGEMGPLVAIVKPDDVVLTNVGTRWRYRFSSRSEQISELLAIGRYLPPDGWFLVGEAAEDVQLAAQDLPGSVYVKGVSPNLPSFVRRAWDGTASEVHVQFPDGRTDMLSVLTPSEELLNDVELAISAAWSLGLDSRPIAAVIQGYAPTSTRLETWRSPSGLTLVRDVVTPDPMAVSSALRAATRLVRDGGRRVVVLGEPNMAWDQSAVSDLAQTLSAEGVDEVLGLAHDTQRSVAEAMQATDSVTPVRLFESADELQRYLVDNLRLGDVCLVQSPPGRPISDMSGLLVEAMAPNRLYLDMSAMEDNVATFRRLVGPSVRIMAMVKALAYGTDAIAVSLALLDSGVDFLGVSGADEGIALRRAGVTLPILVLLGTETEIDKMVRHGLTPLVYSETMAKAVSSYARAHMTAISVHVEVETGMHRTGLDWDESSVFSGSMTAIDCIRELSSLDKVEIEGLMTHLASADDPSQDPMTLLQLQRFEHVAAAARELGTTPILHAAATAGTVRFPAARYDMVRVGLGLFGLHPSEATAQSIHLEPVISLVSRLVQVSNVPEGEGVGYGGTWLAPPGGGRVGVVPAGYHDCIPRSFSNFGYVIVANARCQIIGRVSMDSMTIDLSHCPSAGVGSEVLIYGRMGKSLVALEEVSQAIHTIPYEVMARVGPRVQRVFSRH